MALVIDEVRLRDFLSHRDTALRLGRGVTVLVGRNGSGKSSIVDAIYIALTHPGGAGGYPRGGKENLINRAARLKSGRSASASVELRLSGPGETLTSRVEISLRGGRETSRVRWVRGGEPQLARSVREARRLIAEALGIPEDRLIDVIDNTVVLRQGALLSVTDFLSRGGQRALQFLRTVFGVEQYAEARDRLRSYMVRTSAGSYPVTRIEELRRHLREKRRELEEAGSRIRGLQAELERAREELARLEEEIAGARRRLEELEPSLEEYTSLRARLDSASRRADRLRREVNSIRGALDRLGCRGLEERLRRAQRLVEQAGDAADRYPQLLAMVRELEARRRSLKDLVEAAERLEEILREDPEKRLATVRSRLAELRSEEKKARERAAGLRSLEKNLRDAAKEAAMLLGGEAPGSPVEMLEALRRLASRLDEEWRRLDEESTRLRAAAGTLEEEARKLLEIARKLLTGGEARCPVCGRRLEQGEAERLRKQHEEEARRKREEARGLRSRAESLRREASSLRARLNRAEAAVRLLEGLVREARELGADPARIGEEIERLGDKLRRLEREVEALRLEEARLSALLEEAKRLEERLRRGGVEPLPGAAAQLRRQLEEAERRLEETRRELARLERALLEATGARSAQEALEEVRRARRLLSHESTEECRRLQAQLSEKERSLREAEDEARSARERLRGLETLVSEAGELRRALEDLEGRARRASVEVGRLQGLLDRAREERERLEKLVRELEDAERRLELVRQVRDVLLPRIEEAVFRERLRELSNVASTILEGFALNYVGVSFEVEKRGVRTLAIARDGSTSAVSQLSGGESTAIALAVVLALNKMMAGRIGFLILDEPTVHLDEERKAMLVELLRRYPGERAVSQLIVVTHDEEVREAADEVCRVEYREPEGSRVVCGEA